jgi:hypothetical protein
MTRRARLSSQVEGRNSGTTGHELGGWALVLCALAIGCSDEGEADGSGGAPAPSVGGSDVGAAPATGGSGGSGASGGSGGGGQGGCTTAPEFTVEHPDYCVLARWATTELALEPFTTTPSWGRHGGLLTVEATPTEATLTRWAPGEAGALVGTPSVVPLTGIPADAFFGGLAIDLTSPAGDACRAVPMTALAWTGTDFVNDGAIVTIGDDMTVETATATGVFGMAAAADKLFYTGLSAPGGPTNDDLALYAAGALECSLTLASGDVADAAFGNAAGPVVADGDGNLFAIMTDFLAGTQTVRGYRAQAVLGPAPLAGPVTMATFSGYGDALAALRPRDGHAGLVLLQPNGADGLHGDVLAIAYTTAGGSLQPAAASTFLALATPDQNVTLVVGEDELWVGTTSGDPPTTTFSIVGRRP